MFSFMTPTGLQFHIFMEMFGLLKNTCHWTSLPHRFSSQPSQQTSTLVESLKTVVSLDLHKRLRHKHEQRSDWESYNCNTRNNFTKGNVSKYLYISQSINKNTVPYTKLLRFEVPTAGTTKITGFLAVTPCNLDDSYKCFEWIYFLHLQKVPIKQNNIPDSITSQSRRP